MIGRNFIAKNAEIFFENAKHFAWKFLTVTEKSWKILFEFTQSWRQ